MPWIKGPTHRVLCDHVPTGEYTGPGYCTRGIEGRAAEFRSASVTSVLADQLRNAGWSIAVKTSVGPILTSLDILDVKGLSGRRTRLFFCPAHRPKPREITLASVK